MNLVVCIDRSLGIFGRLQLLWCYQGDWGGLLVWVDDEGLMELKKNVYSFPLYRDVDSRFLQGPRRQKTWNLQEPNYVHERLDVTSQDWKATCKAKGNLIGEALMKRGSSCSEKSGQQEYCYVEETFR